MAKKKNNEPSNSLSFEDALGKLETIVQSLEEGKVGLEESLALYEQGAALLKQGHQLLTDAEHRIEQVSGVDADGNPILQPFAASSGDSKKPAAGHNSKAKTAAKKAGRGKKPSTESDLF